MFRGKIELNTSPEKIIKSLKTNNMKLLNTQKMENSVEYYKCRENPLYFIYNYVYIPETGGKLKYDKELMHTKFKRAVRSIMKFHKVILMASRQLGKSTIAAALIAWAMLYYPGVRVVILNMKKDAAQENLKRIRFIYDNIPDWMKCGVSSRSEIKTYWELSNGSRVDTFYPSSTQSPDTLSRSLTVPILYVDECAFIRHIETIWGSAQQTLSKARVQAKKNNYPYFILLTSTPNGVDGDGKFFYDMWENAIDSDDLFINGEDNRESWSPSTNDLVNDQSTNGFIKIQYKWNEDKDKDEDWYREQCRELNFDKRKINQELDLKFIGGSHCIFDDEILEKLNGIPKIFKLDCKHQTYLNVYDKKLSDMDYYLIGVDTASSIYGAFNAIEIFSFLNFNQIAEMNVKLGSLHKYAEVVDDVFRKIRLLVGDRIILCIENNSIGKSIIEHLLYNIQDIDYRVFIYKNKDKDEYGINTNASTKELMISMAHEYIKENPERIKSQKLISQLSSIERTNAGTLSKKSFSDMFMATCFTAFVKKQKAIDILPLINLSNQEISDNIKSQFEIITSMTGPKGFINNDNLLNTEKQRSLGNPFIIDSVVEDEKYNFNENIIGLNNNNNDELIDIGFFPTFES